MGSILNVCHTLFDRDPTVRRREMNYCFNAWRARGIRDLDPEFSFEDWYDEFGGLAHHAQVIREVLNKGRSYVYCCVNKNVGVETIMQNNLPSLWADILEVEEDDVSKARLGAIALSWHAHYLPVLNFVVQDVVEKVALFPGGVTYELLNPDVVKWYAFGSSGLQIEAQYASLLAGFPVSAYPAALSTRLNAFKSMIVGALPSGASVIRDSYFCYNHTGTASFIGWGPKTHITEVGGLYGANRTVRLRNAIATAKAVQPRLTAIYCGPARSLAYLFKESLGTTETAWQKALYDPFIVAQGFSQDSDAIAPTSDVSILRELCA